MTDLAARVYNHTWKIDPIVRSVIDTDFYKLLMAQTIFRRLSRTQVTFGIINRSANVPIAKLIDIGELREQLDHIRSLRLTRGESTWLRGNTFYGKRQMFTPDFMTWLEGFRFPAYNLERRGDQYELIFDGPWIETTMWEIPALAVIMELRSRAVLRGLGKFGEADAAFFQLLNDLRPLGGVSPLRSQFGSGAAERANFLGGVVGVSHNAELLAVRIEFVHEMRGDADAAAVKVKLARRSAFRWFNNSSIGVFTVAGC